MSTDQKGTKILARTFFNQLRAGGYTANQIIGIATELIDLVASDIREGDKALPTPLPQEGDERKTAAV